MKYISILFILFIPILTFPQNFDAELISQETNIKIIKDKLNKNYRYEIKINNREGEKYTKISIPYSNLNKVSNIEAYIKDSNGKTVKKLKKNEIVDRSSISNYSFYEDYFLKEFTLKHNSYPYTIIYSYQIQQTEFIYIDHWIPIINKNVPTLNADLTVTVPINYEIKYKCSNIDSPKIDTLIDNINYHWNSDYSGLSDIEIYAPPLSDFLPSVEIVPENFIFEKEGSLQNWITYGNWQNELIAGLNKLPVYEKEKIHSLLEGINDEKKKIEKLFHYLQDETRYINITIETGGLKPYPASYVAQNKYGDCKALTNYFKSILENIGIKSFYTKVFAGNPISKIDTNFPSQQFNHIILYIPLKDENIWLDCTSDLAFNYLGTFTQNRKAFIIGANNSHFINTPVLKSEEVAETRKINIRYNTNSATVNFDNLYKGDLYEEIATLDSDYTESEKTRIIQNYILEDGFQLVNYEIEKQDRDSKHIRISFEANSNNIYKFFGNDLLLSNFKFALYYLEKPNERNLPVQIDYPIYKTDTLIYEIPIGFQLQEIPEDYTLSSKFGKYFINFYQGKNNITVIKSLLINSGQYPLSEYNEFYNFYNRVISTEHKTHLTLNK